eukprot:2314008-Rhodomonas_salina.1
MGSQEPVGLAAKGAVVAEKLSSEGRKGQANAGSRVEGAAPANGSSIHVVQQGVGESCPHAVQVGKLSACQELRNPRGKRTLAMPEDR